MTTNQKWEPKSTYYSGQGVILLAERRADGTPKGFFPVGNVPDLKLTVAVSNLEHKESTSGQRATDFRQPTETKVSLAMTIENFNAANLSRAARGSLTEVTGATVTDESHRGYIGGVTALGKIALTAFGLKQGATTLVEYTNDSTPWDYKVNMDGGSFIINDGAALATSALGIAATGVTVGATTTITVANTASAGDLVRFAGFAGADAASLNGVTVAITSATPTAIVVPIDTTGDTITFATSKVIIDGAPVLATYTYADQKVVEALTEAPQEMFMRFEGLNTSDDNNPVIVEVFRFSIDPFKELALIGDTIGQFVLEGSVLYDATRATGSKFFREQLL